MYMHFRGSVYYGYSYIFNTSGVLVPKVSGVFYNGILSAWPGLGEEVTLPRSSNLLSHKCVNCQMR